MDAVVPLVKAPLGMPRRLLRLRSDAVLAERFGAGDEAAFAVLYERHRASVLAVCMGVLGSNHDAEDAAQDAFSALAVTLREHPPRELRAWLARVARNAAIDVARRRRRTVNTDGEVPDVPAAQSGAKAELENVMAGIRELPESQRTALLMRELAGHSYAEIAALLETDEEAVRGLIARARMGLRTHREASELSCASAREALAAEPNGSTHNKTVRRHVRGCAPCRAYKQALRSDARALRGILPGAPVGGVAGGGAIFGGLAAKGALVGGAVTQMTAACAVSVCAVGGAVLLYPSPQAHRRAPARLAHAQSGPAAGHRGSGSATSATPARATTPSAQARTRLAGGRAQSGGSAGPAGWTGSRTGARAATGTATAGITATIPGSGPSSSGRSPGTATSAGYTGFTGSTRPAGSTGYTGSTGSTGSPEATGSIGAQGPSGYGGSLAGSASRPPTGFTAATRQPSTGSAPHTGAGYAPQGAGSAPSASNNAGPQHSFNRGASGTGALGGSAWARPSIVASAPGATQSPGSRGT
jgi:RNA polymerase sigma factor (sigma-70 family)